jgi:hypothetical protein
MFAVAMAGSERTQSYFEWMRVREEESNECTVSSQSHTLRVSRMNPVFLFFVCRSAGFQRGGINASNVTLFSTLALSRDS